MESQSWTRLSGHTYHNGTINCIKKNYSCFTMLYSFLPYGKVDQPHEKNGPSVWTSFPCRSAQCCVEFSVLYSGFSLAIYFGPSNVHRSIPVSQVTPPPSLPPLVSICLFSTSASPFLPCKQIHRYHFLDSTYMH